MILRSGNEIRRARPFLGTTVEIAGHASPGQIDAAFLVISKIHRLMSFHDPGSDVSRMNREALRQSVIVNQSTWRVLKIAEELSRESDGAFDITVRSRSARKSSWRDIILGENYAVRFRRALKIDLGGIAKGFAVDCAVQSLQRAGVLSGIVNAGGDLRVFGLKQRMIHLRNPNSAMRFCKMLGIDNRALATSANYFAPGALINGQTGKELNQSISVTTAANDCMTADALTKVVFVLREKSAPLLFRFGADALLLERDGSPFWTFRSPCAIHDPIR